MTRRNPPAKWVLPTIVNPAGRRCFVIEVPDEPQHIAAFRGAILDLASAYKWSDDTAHTAREVALVWRDVYNNMKSCADILPRGSAGADEGVEQLIRQNPDNPCLLETSINGTDWCAFADLSLCIQLQGQLGVGAEQPRPGGGCVKYHVYMPANSLYLLPTSVSTGDTITITNPSGAANDGGETVWRTPTGGQFVAGVDIGGYAYNAGDPQPATPHMALILKIGSSYYSFAAFAFSVPAGIANQPIILQVNDSAIANDYGGFNFDVEVCNNQAAAWTRDYNFAVSPDGWFVDTTPRGAPWGQYAGAYFQTVCQLVYVGDSGYYSQFRARIDWPATLNVTKLSATVTTTKGTNGPYNESICQLFAPASTQRTNDQGIANGTNTFTFTGAITANSLAILIETVGSAPDCSASGDGQLLSVHVEGTGTPPP